LPSVRAKAALGASPEQWRGFTRRAPNSRKRSTISATTRWLFPPRWDPPGTKAILPSRSRFASSAMRVTPGCARAAQQRHVTITVSALKRVRIPPASAPRLEAHPVHQGVEEFAVLVGADMLDLLRDGLGLPPLILRE